MSCRACGGANPEGARFCGSCGATLSGACPHCGEPALPDNRFCTACGEAVRAADTPAAAAGTRGAREAVAERRRVSVLFVDIEDFTRLGEQLDPEEIRTVQSRYFEAARSVVASYGGTIEKFIGDAVMAVWGAPLAHEDDAERAVRAAIDLVHAVRRLGGVTSNRSLAARAAVTSGEAAVTLGAVGQGMVAGDLVNAAARLQSMAPAGGVLVDAATREMAPAAAAYEPVGELSLKGRTTPVAAFRAAVPSAPRHGVERASHAGPFVGRDRELAELVELLERTVRDRRSRLVSITGVAGIGKSRLAWELGEHVEAIPQQIAWHTGRAPAYGDEVTFTAVADMLRRRIRLSDDAEPELARRQLRAALSEIVRDDAERAWMEPRLAVLLAPDPMAAFDRDELFAAWRRFFERVSDSAPTVLVFEDIQWADPSLLDFIEHVAAWAREHPILVVTLARPELLERRPRWGAGVASFSSLHLERLPDEVIRKLLGEHRPSIPPRLVPTILARAGGIPLYAVEVARALADLAPDDEGSAVEVPESLHGVIATRIDALPAEERRLLLTAAVLGRRFRPDALRAVATVDADAVRRGADALVRRELLAIDEELASPGRGELAFVQDLVREVAYGTLSRAERRSLHLAAARWLEGRAEDDIAESLAGHLLEAHRLAPEHPDGHRVARRAVAALRRASHNAMRLHLPHRALDHLEHALKLTDVADQRAVVLDEAAAAARASARLTLAEEHLRELVKLHADAGRRRESAAARASLASVLLMDQRNASAIAELETALRAGRRIETYDAGVELASQLARAKMLVGEHRPALRWADRALEAAEQRGLEAVATDILITRGTARFSLGEEDAGLADLRRAVERAEAAGYLTTELRARNNLAWLVVTDDPRASFDAAREAVTLATAMGVGDIAAQLGEVATAVAVDTGDWDWALATAEELAHGPIPDANRLNMAAAVAIIRALRGDPEPMAKLDALGPLPADADSQIQAGVTFARAWAAFIEGGFETSHRLAEEAAHGWLGPERVDAWALAGRAALWHGDVASATSARDAIRSSNLPGRTVDARLLTADAGIAALRGELTAHDAYRAAAQAWRQLDLPLHLALCQLDEHVLTPGSEPPDDALAILENLRAEGLLRLLRPQPAAARARPARSRRPSGRTASPTDAARPKRPGSHPRSPAG
jgi:class 3 adenylate cyclase/tetratricopeptide (TPR) repeat protein